MIYDSKTPTSRMLAHLNARVISDDGTTAIVQVMPDMPQSLVSVPSKSLRSWCQKRIESRMSHREYGIGCGIMRDRYR